MIIYLRVSQGIPEELLTSQLSSRSRWMGNNNSKAPTRRKNNDNEGWNTTVAIKALFLGWWRWRHKELECFLLNRIRLWYHVEQQRKVEERSWRRICFVSYVVSPVMLNIYIHFIKATKKERNNHMPLTRDFPNWFFNSRITLTIMSFLNG